MDILNDPGFYGLAGSFAISFILLRIFYPIRPLRVVFGIFTYGSLTILAVLLIIHFSTNPYDLLGQYIFPKGKS